MTCWHCGEKVIWGGDHTFEDYCIEGEGLVTNLSCSKCSAEYLCYLSDEDLGIEVESHPIGRMIDKAIHEHPLGAGFAQKDNKASG